MANPIKDWESFMNPGLGFNSASNTIRGQAVTVQPLQSTGDGQTILFSCHKTESVEDLCTQIGLSVDASGSAGLFGGSDKFDFVQSKSLHSFSVFMVVSINVKNATQHMLGEQLLPAAAELLSSGDNDRFLATFGDYYIKGVESGGEFFAIIEIQTSDTNDQSAISNSLDVAGFFGDGGVDLKSNFTSKFQKVTQSRSLDISSYQRGGQGEGAKQKVTPGELLDKALNFANDVFAHPTPYRAELQDYVALDPPKPPNVIDIQNAKDVLQQFATNRNILLQFINDVTFILSNPDQFDTPKASVDLNALANQAREMINEIKQAASSCMDDVRACKLITINLPDRSVLPSRKQGAKKVTIPSVVGKVAEDAHTTLAALGLQSSSEPTPVETSAALYEIQKEQGVEPQVGHVLSQTPGAGEVVEQGTTITLSVISAVNFAPGTPLRQL